MNPLSGDPGHDRRPARGSGRPLLRATLLAAAALTLVAVTATVAAAARDGGPGPGGRSRAVSVTAGPVAAVDFQGVPGQVVVVGTTTGQVRLTGQLDWAGRAPLVTTRLDGADHVLRLSFRCATASPCTGNYRIVVPRRTAIVMQQPAGHVVLSGLAGPLRITAGNVDVSATGLRSPSLVAVITSGHLGAVFDAPPRQVSVTLTSAQATLWLPASARYAVSAQVTAGYLRVAIPQASNSARTVTARVVSGELEFLPRSPGTRAPG